MTQERIEAMRRRYPPGTEVTLNSMEGESHMPPEILTSNSKDNAVRLLDPYRANLEANGRIMAYYGKQELPGSWTCLLYTSRCV